MTTPDQKEESTKVSIHSIKNLLGSVLSSKEFHEDKVREFANIHGIELTRQISEFGMELTDLQHKVMEAILHGFTKTKYKGNADPLEKSIVAREKYPTGHLPSSYKYLEQIPKLRVKQAELLKWAGVSKGSPGDVQRALKALKHLGTSQYCFFYTRLAYDKEGNPKRDKEGWQMEEVLAIDNLFTVKEIRNKKTRVLEYYEIIPSPIFLDQVETYFMLIPFNWREEVLNLVGQRRASSYTFRFLLYLRYQSALQTRKVEDKRISVLKVPFEEMAIILKMPESLYIKNKDRANKILEDAYFVAKRLGYINQYERTENYDVFYLNEKKFVLSRDREALVPIKEEEKDNSQEMHQAKELFDLMISERRKLDPRYNPIAGGQIREQSLKHLIELIKIRPFEEVKSVILWGIHKKYWCNRIGTPSKLRQNFDEAISEKRALDNVEDAPNREQKNREWVQKVAQKVDGSKGLLGTAIKIEILNQEVEIGEGTGYPTSVKFSDKGFKEQIENALRKRGISLTTLF